MNRITRSAGLLATLATLGGCSTAKPGATPNDSSPGTSSAPVRAPLVPLETRPVLDSSMQGPLLGMSPPAADTATGDGAVIARLEREARALAHSTGCSSAGACRTAPVGVRACGGPRSYIVYCAASTDTVALARKLRELERVERARNERTGAMGTCEMRMPPSTTITGGSCRESARPSGPRGPS